MKTIAEAQATTVAATVFGEDVNCGDYVALLNVTCELPSYLWDDCQATLPPQELMRLRFIPDDAGVPLKVFAVCLPFVYAKRANGELKTLDLRLQQIVRLSPVCAKRVWNALKTAKKPN